MFSPFAAWAPRRPVRSFVRGAPVWLVVAFALTGCAGNEDALGSASGAGSKIVELFWVMVAVSCVGFALVAALLFAGWFRRHQRDGSERGLTTVVIVLGVAVPVVILSALFVWADIFVVRSTAAPAPGSAQLTVRVVAHDWWWEVRYPGTTAVTANVIHIPIRHAGRGDRHHRRRDPQLLGARAQSEDRPDPRPDGLGAPRRRRDPASTAASVRSSAASSTRT